MRLGLHLGLGAGAAVGTSSPPALTSISPSSAHESDAPSTLTATGANFTPTSILRFDGANQATTYVSATSITCPLTPSALSAALHTVDVTDTTGTSGGKTLAIDHAAPSESSLSPTSALVGAGNTLLTITGAGFDGTESVVAVASGGGTTTLASTYVSATQITATMPSSLLTAAGTYSIYVVEPTPGGGTSLAQTFTVNHAAPTLTAVSPTSVAAGAGATTITLTGTGFDATTTAFAGGTSLTTTFVSATSITAIVPTGIVAVPGNQTITAVNGTPGGGTSAGQTLAINYPTPTTNALSVTSGTVGDGNTVTRVTGTGFYAAGTTAKINDAAATGAYVDATHFDVTVPSASLASAGTLSITIVNPSPGGGTSGAQTFTVNHAAPTLSSISPTSVAAGAGSTTITLTGTGYDATTTVYAGASALTTTYVSPTSVTAVVPSGTVAVPGNYSITAVNGTPGGGTSAAQTLAVNYPTPTTSAISVAAANAGAGNIVTQITGTGFYASGTIAKVDGVTVTSAYVDATHINVTVPSAVVAQVGTHAITIVNPTPGGGTSGAQNFVVTWAVDLSAVTPGVFAAASLLAQGSGGLVLTRASVATVQTAAATVDSTPAVDDPRVSNLDGTKRGLLIEESRTNAVQQSRALDNASGYWTAGTGATITADQAAGPDGSTKADECVLTSSGDANHKAFTLAAATRVGTAWSRAKTGTTPLSFRFGTFGTDLGYSNSAISTTWQRVEAKSSLSNPYFAAQDHGTSGGRVAGPSDAYFDFMQMEDGAFPTSAIVTAGSSVTRSGDRLRHNTPASLLDGGRLGLYFTLYPRGSSSEFAANMRLWSIDANNYAEINFSTRVVTVVIGGVSRALGTALPTWARHDKLEIWLAAGGGTLTSDCKARVNGGTVTNLGSGTAQSAISAGANPLEFLCSGTASQFSSMLNAISAYAAGQVPAWAV